MKWLNHFLDLIYPRTCEACENHLLSEEKLICTHCMMTLPQTKSHLDSSNHITKKFWGKIPVRGSFSYLKFIKKSRVQKLLHELKYRNKPELGKFLGELYGKDLKKIQLDEKIDLIIGVPLHKEKYKQRGYNQADCFAEGLSVSLGIPFDEKSVIRIKNTETQTKKSRIDRFRNVEDIFKVVEKEKILGKRIAIVDDVLTTGSTLESLGKKLLDEGCSEITFITLATAV
jgi:ComF family protein